MIKNNSETFSQGSAMHNAHLFFFNVTIVLAFGKFKNLETKQSLK